MTITITGAYDVGSGQTASFSNPTSAPYTLSGTGTPSLLDQGTIQVSSSQSNATVEAFTDDGTLYPLTGLITVALGASVSVTASASGETAYGYLGGSAPAILENDGTFTVSATGGATTYAFGASFQSNVYSPSFAAIFDNTGSFQVSGATATGVRTSGAEVFANSGTFNVQGSSLAYGFDFASTTSFGKLVNSGQITVSATSGVSYGIYIDGAWSNLEPVSITNSGSITAQHAIYETDSSFSSSDSPRLELYNSGTITGDIVLGSGPSATYQGVGQARGARVYNSGTINGAIHLTTNGIDLYDGRGGHQTGGIDLGAGTDIVYLGNDGETVVGGTGTAAIFGGSGADTITGGSGADIISGGGGSDTLTGGPGADTFLISAAAGAVIITDFSDAQGDRIDLTALSAFTSLADVQAHAAQSGNNTVITFGASASLTLQNVQLSNLTASDFSFFHTYSPTAAPGALTGAHLFTGTNAGAGAYAVAGNANITDNAFVLVVDGAASDTAAGMVFGSATASSTLDVTAPATLTVDATGSGAAAYGIRTTSAGVYSNEGAIRVSATGQATGAAMSAAQYLLNSGTGPGVGGLNFENEGGTFAVSGNVAIGVDSASPAGTVFANQMNSGTFTVTGVASAIGIRMVAVGPYVLQPGGSPYFIGFQNSGQFTVTASAGSAYGIEFGGPNAAGETAPINNSGTITAQHAIVAIETTGTPQDPDLHLTNTGTINGSIELGYGPSAVAPSSIPTSSLAYNNQILNSGAINGLIQLSHNGHDLYDGRGGTQTGGIALGGGSAVIYLGNDGETVSAGYGGSAVIHGGTGNDSVHAGAGNDTIDGGAGTNLLDGGGGLNTLSYAWAGSGVTVSLAVQSAQNTGVSTDTVSNFQNLTGSAYNDTLEGNAGDNALDGGGGVNTVSYANATAGVAVNLGLQGQAQGTGGGGNDTLSNFQNIIGSAFDDRLTDNSADNVLTGGAGADVFVMGGGGHDTIADFSHAEGDQIDLSRFNLFHSFSDVVAAARQNGADTVITAGASTVTLKNVQASSLVAGDFVVSPAGAGLQINVNYDASVSNAPAGFITAVQAAVQFFESTFSNHITININVGWGEFGGQTLSPDDAGESRANWLPVSYGALRAALITADASSPAAAFAARALAGSDPTGGDTFMVNSAEAKALGLAANYAVDGSIGISSGGSYTFDPTNRAVSGKTDAIGLLEHEISEILGRDAWAGQTINAVSVESPLDLFRYSAAEVHSYQVGPGYFSLDGFQLLKQFNNHAIYGGDTADWLYGAAPAESFDYGVTPGVALDVSSVDVRVMEALGYHVGFGAPAVAGTPVTPATISQTGSLAGGQSLSFSGSAAILFSPTSSQTGPSFTNAGTITNSGAASDVDVTGLRYDPNAPATLAGGVAATFTNTSTGRFTVDALAPGSDAVGFFYGATSLVNSGQIQVTSSQADAFGDIGVSYTGNTGSSLTVQGVNEAIGIDTSGVAATNAGSIQVTGLRATGVAYAPSLNNSGVITVTGGNGGYAYGVYEGFSGQTSAQVTNSNVITAQVAIAIAPFGGDPMLVATVTNTGTLNGAVLIGDGAVTFDSHLGTINGPVDLVGGSSTVTLGAENNTVYLAAGVHVVDGGGGTNTVSYAVSKAGVAVSLALQGQVQNTGVGLDTLSHFQNLIGSPFNDRLGGGTGVNFLTGGGGADVFVFAPGDGTQTLTDFSDPQGDKINLGAFVNLHTLSDVLALASQSGPDTILNLGGGTTVTLNNITAVNLTAADFILGVPDHDFNGDGLSDILWRNDSGDVSVWLAQSGGSFTSLDLGLVPSNWTIDGTGDFNGDGKADILWRNANGDVQFWINRAGADFAGQDLGIIPTSWHVARVNDFNADGKADILWRDDSGDISIWLAQGGGSFASFDLGLVPSSWTIAGTGDFNGDGKADILWRNANGDVQVWSTQVGSGVSFSGQDLGIVPITWQIQGVSDFDGDGKADILWRGANGDVQLWKSKSGGGFASQDLGVVPTSWQVQDLVDVNGDGRADIVWRNDSGDVALWIGEASSNVAFAGEDLGVVPANWHIQSQWLG